MQRMPMQGVLAFFSPDSKYANAGMCGYHENTDSLVVPDPPLAFDAASAEASYESESSVRGRGRLVIMDVNVDPPTACPLYKRAITITVDPGSN